ncbi:unnamed protein product [Effrenium voratum]|nr:unnamed protein product [Effrenium voratum]
MADPMAEPLRVAILGQKDAMIFCLFQLVQVRRTRSLEVLVLSPKEQTVPPSADVAAVCSTLGYQHCVARTNAMVLESIQQFKPSLLARRSGHGRPSLKSGPQLVET